MDFDKKDFIEDNFSFDEIKPKTTINKTKPKQQNDLKFSFDFNKIKNININNRVKILLMCIILLLIFIIITLIFNRHNLNKEKVDTKTIASADIKELNTPFSTFEFIKPLYESLGKSNYKQFENLKAKYNNNQDIVAYLSIFGTTINSPVTQSTDNTFYIDHDISKQKNIDGTIFLDATSNINEFDENTIIYGKTDIKDKQLYDLNLYDDPNFYANNRFINFDTTYNSSVWYIFSYYKCKDENFYLKTNFNETEFKTFITSIKNLSKYELDTDISNEDNILTLTSTNNKGEKCVLHAKLYKNK